MPEHIFFDLHCDTVMRLLAGSTLNCSTNQVNLPYMKAAKIYSQMFACYVPHCISENKRADLVWKMLEKLEEEIDINADAIVLCKNATSLRQAITEQKIAALFSIENGTAIENDLKNLKLFFERGIRCMTIVHAKNHDWAISATDKNPKFDGLTAFGEKVISAMNEMGIIIDISHAHDRTVEKILSITRKPIIASHSCVYALCPAPRNLKDHLIMGIADSGGMIGINLYSGFLDAHYHQAVEEKLGGLFADLTRMETEAGDDIAKISWLFDEFSEKLQQTMQDVKVPLDRIIEHVDYIVQLVGDDFVGFGSDFDGTPATPEEIDDCRGFNLIREKLIAKGYSESRIAKICHQNFMRVFENHQP